MRSRALTLRFRNEETLRILEETAEALGVSAGALAEAAIERELAVVGSNLEARLSRTLESLRSTVPADLERDAGDFARSELEFEDPLKARLVESPDAYGIGALFGHRLERG
jgi:hypothetical protein